MPDTPLIRDVLLRDGTTLRLRAPTQADLDDIKAFYDRLSTESRYMRFHGLGRTDLAARHDAEAEGVDRVSLVGRQGDRVVAVAGYDRLREPGAAEVAFAVADDFRGRGAATRLLEQLADVAARSGISRFDAEVLTSNRPMLGVFRRAGFGLRRQGAFGEVTVSMDITPSAEVIERIDERDHRAAVASLRPLLAPASIVVLGEEQGPVWSALRGSRFRGHLVERPPADLAILTGGEDQIARDAEAAVAAGARSLLALGGEHGAGATGQRLLEIVRSAGVRLVGPNSLGVVNTDPSVLLQATAARPEIVPGRLAICSQSGAVGIGLLGHAAARRLGVSAFVSLGDRFDVSTNDLLELWEEDERTAALMLYVETFGNPERFARIARRVSRRKPILAVRGHRTEGAQLDRAASHTAAALRGDAAVDALLHQSGVMRFRSGEGLFNAAQYFESQPLPAGNRVGIVSNSSGVARLAEDACLTRGLVVGEVGQTVDGFAAAARGSGGAPRAAANPALTGIGVTPEQFRSAICGLLADTGIDAVLAYYVDPGSGHASAVLETVTSAAAEVDKPVVASIVGAGGRPAEFGTVRTTRPVANFLFPEACAAVIARGVERRRWLSRPLGQVPELEGLDREAARELVEPWLADVREGEERWIDLDQAGALVQTHALPLTASHRCRSVQDAVRAAAALGGPVALKADFPPPAHAGDIDAVLLGLQGEEGVRSGWGELRRRVAAAGRSWSGVLVQPLVPAGADVLLGSVRDPALGPLIALGLGGRQAGLLATASFRLPPVTDVDADELIASATAVATQLEGFRGQPPLDHEALRDLILRFAALLRAVPEILEADLNPVRLMPRATTILDLRVRIGPLTPVRRTKTW